MASIMDRGDSYRVEYLGSAMLMHAATGLGVLQKPLRDLYFQYQQSGSRQGTLQERHLTMTSNGVNMVFKDSRASPTQEVFYPMPSILFWDAVQFATVRGQDKKIRGAFEPLDNDHSRNKDNLFVVLEKKYHFLQQRAHPAIFTCVLRRTSGVKALDVHAFICTSDEEAMGLVHALNAVQSTYTSDQVSETGVFGYNPFGKESVRSTAGLERLQAAQQRLRPHSVTPAHEQTSAAIPRGHPLPVVSPVSRSESIRSTSSNVSNSSRVYQLTQNDLIQPSAVKPKNDFIQPSAPKAKTRKASKHLSPVTETHGDFSDHTYQYIQHIDKSLERPSAAAARNVKVSDGQPLSSNNSQSAGIFVSPVQPRNGQATRPNQLEYGSITRSVDLDDETLRAPNSASVGSRGSTTGQGYGLLSGSGHPIPGQHPPQHFYNDSSDRSPGPERTRSRSPSYETTLPRDPPVARALAREFQRSDKPPGSPNLPPRTESPAARVRGLPRRELPPTPLQDDYRSPQSPTESQYAQIQGKDRPGSRFVPDNPNRPVAKVPPQPPSSHKRTGVKVLPTAPVAPLRSSPDDSPAPSRPKSTYYEDSSPSPDQDYGLPPRRAQSQYFNDKQFHSDPTPTPRAKANKYESNWQFKPSGSAESDCRTMSPEEMAQKTTGRVGEKLLLSQKKDAEIASVMQDLHFDFDRTYTRTNTMSPGGTNFEKSLGYFP